MFDTIKIQMVFEGFWGHEKREKADVIWREFDAICTCVCPLIDHDQQPMIYMYEGLHNCNSLAIRDCAWFNK